ncbi:hypothetical protein OH491_24095 [Termitidicoccus mucosus]|uniref:Uncharacterized protein n=1 Tax=Termitidicoccus mucosus TaxID=1184151 RepID=A0A178IP71_9BACT|nr:hypothetical protein AW736_02360 [Opitutaceae bacterium TSB47]
MINKYSCRLIFGLVCVFANVGSLAFAEAARRAFDFVDGIGVNIKCPSWRNHQSNYANIMLVEKSLVGLGIRHYRTNAKDVDADWAFYHRLYVEHGLQADLLHIGHFFPRFGERLRTFPDFIKYVEGVNEVDPPRGIMSNWSYRGQPYPAGAIRLQQEIYHTVKHDPATRAIPVIVPSVSRYEHQADLAGSEGDRQNMHSYPAGKRPSTLLSEAVATSDKVFTIPKPIVATETGYTTAVASPQGGTVSELAKTKYTPRLVAEYWNHPRIERLYFYELIDTGDDPLEFEHGFGFVRPDGTVKPAFTALQSLVRLLDDSPARFRPEGLDFRITGDAGMVHHTVLQKRNGDFYILLWQEVDVYDAASKSDIQTKDAPVVVGFGRSPVRAVVHRYDDLGRLSSSSADARDGTIRINVPDTVTILQLTLAPETPAVPVSSP